jgi:hypothetical protein
MHTNCGDLEEQGMTGMRAARVAICLALALATCSTFTGTALGAEDEGELVDVSKTVENLGQELVKLRERGRWARQGELSAAAVCGDDAPAPAFSAWGDGSSYVPAPEGNLESTARWTLNKHARRAENSPYSSGGSSLLLPDHGEAISPAFCVSTAYPTIRLFAANTAGEESELEIEILYEDLDGKVKKLKVAKLRGKPDWAPTTVGPLHVNLLGAASEDGFTAVAVKFKAKDVKSKTGGWKLDDLFVDPWVSGW